MKLNEREIENLLRWCAEYEPEEITLEEVMGGGIGSSIYISVSDEENGFKVHKKYELSSVEDW